MSETTQEVVEQVVDNPLAAAAWGDTPPATATVETTQSVEQPTTATTPTTTVVEEQVIDANEYLKQNLGYENWEVAKQDIEELKKLKETQAQSEIKFANQESEKLFKALQEGNEDDVFRVLSQKKEFERISKLDVNNAKDAAEIIRMNLKLKYSNLDAGEIEDIFNEEYSRYEKPVQGDELDDEYQQKLTAWQSRNEAIDRKIIREAKMAKPEIEKAKSEIVYPNIPVKESQVSAELSQEELAAFAKTKDSFLQSAESVMKTFNGINAVVKDKDVEIPISYDFSESEKTQLNKVVGDFAENGFNANAIFAQRWLNQDKSINTEQMVKDLSKILFGDNVNQKFVNDAANKRLETYLKEKKQVNINQTTTTGSFVPGGEGDKQKAMQDYFWSNV
jgi:hypothetical protein